MNGLGFGRPIGRSWQKPTVAARSTPADIADGGALSWLEEMTRLAVARGQTPVSAVHASTRPRLSAPV
jgi:hypothetical protein